MMIVLANDFNVIEVNRNLISELKIMNLVYFLLFISFSFLFILFGTSD